MEEYYYIGKIVGAHGLKGELLMVHNLGKKTLLKGLRAIFIEEKKESFLPWFIEKTRVKSGTEIYLKLEGIHTRETAMKLVQKKVWLNEADFKKWAARSSPAGLLGFVIIHNNNPLGQIIEVIEQPYQLLCRLNIQGKDVFIPLHEETLQKINHSKKEIEVKLPEGLLEIYLP